MLSENQGAILFFVLMTIGTINVIRNANRDKEKIREYIHSRGADVQTITWFWLTGGRGARTFQVTYLAPNGQSYTTLCKAQTYGFNSGLYWQDAIPDFNEKTKSSLVDVNSKSEAPQPDS